MSNIFEHLFESQSQKQARLEKEQKSQKITEAITADALRIKEEKKDMKPSAILYWSVPII